MPQGFDLSRVDEHYNKEERKKFFLLEKEHKELKEKLKKYEKEEEKEEENEEDYSDIDEENNEEDEDEDAQNDYGHRRLMNITLNLFLYKNYYFLRII